MNTKRSLALVGFAEFFSKALSWLSLAMIPFFATSEIYGQIVLSYSMILFFLPIYLFGQDRLILKNDPDVELNNSLIFTLVIWSVLSLVLYFLGYFLISIAALFLALNKIYLTYFRSKEKIKKYALNRFFYSVFRLFFVFIVVCFAYSLEKYILSEILAAFLVTIGFFINFFRSRNDFDLRYLERIKQGFPLMLHGVSLFGIALVDRFILKEYTDLSVVGNYSFIYVFASGLIFLYSIVSIMQEKKIYLSKSREDLFVNVRKTLFVMLLFGLVGALGSVILYYIVFKFNLIKGYDWQPLNLFILLLAHLVLPFYLLSNYILVQQNKGSYLLFCSIFSLLINIVFNLLLIPRYGLDGAVWATLVTNVILVVATFIVCFKVMKGRETL